jgi:trehalose/maltose hydrolase-like predicted phosphorylase
VSRGSRAGGRPSPVAPGLPPEVGRRFEAVAVGAGLWSEPGVRRLLGELAGFGVSTAVLGGRRSRGRRLSADRSRFSAGLAAANAISELVGLWWGQGIRPAEGLVLVEQLPRERSFAATGDLETGSGPTDLAARPDPDDLATAGPTVLAASPGLARAVLRDQLARRARRDLPAIPPESGWTVAVDGVDPATEPARDVRLAMVDGVTGTLGSPLAEYPAAHRDVFVAGVYSGTGADSELLRIPDWTRLAGRLDEHAAVRRVLDLKTGLVHHEIATEHGAIRAVSFASRARPGICILRAGGSGALAPRSGLLATRSGAPQSGVAGEPSGAPASTPGPGGRSPEPAASVRIRGASGGVAVAAAQSRSGSGESRRLDRLVAVRANGRRLPSEAGVRSFLAEAAGAGFDRLLAEQRAAWASRWSEADVRIEGDPEMQRAIRFALFEMMAQARESGEAAIGARGLTGPKYRGHVFWDTDVFVLPFLAATNPRAARSILEYRVRRLDAARAAAREAGLAGAWFPWESALDGRDVTPDWVTGGDGLPLRVLTGTHELHIVADVAWAAATYADWTGDRAFAAGAGAELLFETARFWASRFERAADGSAHLSGVIGPDEYHNLVADNAFTNVMARWNLRRAASWAAASSPAAPDEPERVAWLELADRIVDGFDRASGLYEQFDGFFSLEPVKIVELATRPLSGEVFLGRDRVGLTQCVKQPDVLMLYHLVPDEVQPGTLGPNLDFYDPRTSHGSSLSPGIHAALMARAGRTDEALAALRMAAFIDLTDAFHRTAEGLHVATIGSLWQAIVLGFAGLRPAGGELTLDPHLPPAWGALEVPFRLRGRRVRVRVEHDRVVLWADRPVGVRLTGASAVVADRGGITLLRHGDRWLVAD